MRVISRDGLTDLPYEHFTILVDRGTDIIAKKENGRTNDRPILLARYPLKAAEGSVQMLWDAYKRGDRVFRFPETSEVCEFLETLK